MKKILLVLKHEFITVVTHRSFILTLILIPLAGFLITFIAHVVSQNQELKTGWTDIGSVLFPTSKKTAEGFVDHTGIIQSVPAAQKDLLIPFGSENEARDALNSGTISAFYVLPADFVQTGLVDYYRPDFNPIGGSTGSSVFMDLVNYWLVNGDSVISSRVANPLNTQTVLLNPQPVREKDNALTFFIPYGVTMLFYILIMGSASLMLSNITTEKTNRMMEMLMTTMTPVQMLTGKIIALGLAGLLQTVVWAGAGYSLLRLSGTTFNLPIAFQLPLSILLWGIFFFIGGYALYASLMAGVGALVPNLREAAQATMLMIIPLVIPITLISLLVDNPNSGFAIFLSLFPLTAPVSMMTRLAATHVPIWQVLLAIAILGITVVLLVRAVARMFRAQNLLSGQPFKFKTFFTALFGKS